MNSVMATQLRPYPGSLISVTNKGEVCLFDPTASERSGLDSIGNKYALKKSNHPVHAINTGLNLCLCWDVSRISEYTVGQKVKKCLGQKNCEIK